MEYLFSLSKYLAPKFHLVKEVLPNYTDVFLMLYDFTLFSDMKYTHTHTHTHTTYFLCNHTWRSKHNTPLTSLAPNKKAPSHKLLGERAQK